VKKYEAAIKLFIEYINSSDKKSEEEYIPVGVSNRHVHLSQRELDILFGANYLLTSIKELSQPGQYACKEMITICGPKGVIEKVRILGPVRKQTQVEVLASDCFKLGIKTEPRLSGDLVGTAGLTLIGAKGSVQIKEGVVIAKRHIHMLPTDASKFGVQDGQDVKVEITGPRGGIFDQVSIRVTNESKLEFHLDTEEANALGVTSKTIIKIVN
jgi:Propanediol utilization protein